MKYYSIIVQIFCFLLPWGARRYLLNRILPIKIHKEATIGISIILARNGILKKGVKVCNFNFINEIDYLLLDEFSKIGRKNWITGSSAEKGIGYKASQNRTCEFKLGVHARITNNHHIDCNGGVYIGDFTTIAGKDTQILTHGIDLYSSVQKADPVNIGKYCFVGTRCLILKGSNLPNKCMLAAGAVMSKSFEDEEMIYGGVPAKPLKKLPSKSKYFFRTHGNVT